MGKRKELRKERRWAEEVAQAVAEGDPEKATRMLLEHESKVPPTGDTLRRMFGVPIKRKQ